MLPLLLVAQLAVASNAGIGSRAATDSAMRERAESTTRAFLAYWHEAWRETQEERRPRSARDAEFSLRDDDTRAWALHCHSPPPRASVQRHIIVGTTPAQPRCPSWYPASAPPVGDERRGIDAALSPTRQRWVSQLRLQLRRLLDSAAQRWPNDLFLTRQQVRFALDGGDLAGAASAAASCHADPIQCGLLQALILHRAGVVAVADSAFLAAADMMAEVQRCAWTDIGALLDRNARERYDAMSCVERASLNARLWWLADPLFMEPGNERRAEHFARKVTLQLLAEPAEDRRFPLHRDAGGESVTEGFVRYGWPTQTYWGGIAVDRGHDQWMVKNRAQRAPPYVVPEYSRNRLHTTPRPTTLDAPFDASADDWQLDGLPDDSDWWPVEHFARDLGRSSSFPLASP